MKLFHILFVIATGVTVLYSDEQALAWFLGKKALLHPKLVQTLHIIVTFGLAGVIITGGMLFLRSSDYYLHDTAFLIKMAFVAALVVNGYFIDTLSAIPTGRTFSSLSHRERLPLYVSGAISFAGWGGALLCGLVLGHHIFI